MKIPEYLCMVILHDCAEFWCLVISPLIVGLGDDSQVSVLWTIEPTAQAQEKYITFSDSIPNCTGVATAKGGGLPLPAGLQLQHGLIIPWPLSKFVYCILHQPPIWNCAEKVAPCSCYLSEIVREISLLLCHHLRSAVSPRDTQPLERVACKLSPAVKELSLALCELRRGRICKKRWCPDICVESAHRLSNLC